jgi:hypothetical protein
MDEQWKHFESRVIQPMGGLASDRVFMMEILGSPQAVEYYAAYTGQGLPSNVVHELSTLASALKRHSLNAAPALKHTHYACIGDFIAYHRQGQDDVAAYEIFRRAAGASSPVSVPAMQAFAGRPMVRYSALVQHRGLARLQRFFDVAIAPGLSDEAKTTQWTWADVLMIVLIISTSVHWEYRIVHLASKSVAFPRLTPRTVAALAAFMVKSLAQRQHEQSRKTHDQVLVEVDANLTHVALTALYVAPRTIFTPQTAAPTATTSEKETEEEEEEEEKPEAEEEEMRSTARVPPSRGRKATDLSKVPAYAQGKGGVYREKK